MRRRYPIPKVWLMTDPRIDDLAVAIARLPRRSGIVFRHYELPGRDRRALFEQVRKLARRHHHVLLLADRPAIARAWGADGAHHRSLLRSQGMRSVAVHSAREADLARRIGADVIFVSPVFATRSHPGAKPLGRARLGLLVGNQRVRTVALGGMTARRAQSLCALRLHGWAAIDAWGG
jgi:thiamine-phosphate pyrophosphorylase